MSAAVRSLGLLVALAGMTALGAQSRASVQLRLGSAELAEGEALRVWVKGEGLSGQRVVLVEGATLLAAGELNLRGEAELVVRNLAPGRRRIMARLPLRRELRSDVVVVQVTGEQGRRRVEERIDIDGALATAAFDADLDGRMDLMVATREELLLLDGNYEPTVKLARWPEAISAITSLLPGDWNGDGRWDVLLGTDTGVELWVAGEQGLERRFRETGYRQPVEADVNGDGMPDVLVERAAADGKTEPWVWMETGAGSFVPVKRQPVETRAAERSGGEWRGSVIAAGVYHSLRLKSDGTVWAWGYNAYGQLGDGTTTDRLTPVPVSGLTGVVAIAGGAKHSLALKSDGTVWAWGQNNAGQLGDGSMMQRPTPIQVSGLTGVVAIAGGGEHSLALKSDGTVWAWGWNYWGQVGDGSTTNRLTPVLASGLTGVVAIGAGGHHSLALKSDGTVWAWGWNGDGELGDGSTTNRLTPAQANGLTGVVAITGGTGHSLAVKSDGTVWAWGRNNAGQLGDGSTTNRLTPVPVSGVTGVVAVAGGSEHSLAVKSDGTVWAWGNNYYGQLGDGSPGDSPTTLVPVSVLTGVVAIAAGAYHSLAVRSDGTVWGWGFDMFGQVGGGQSSRTPVPVSGLTGVGFTAIAAGYRHSLALKSDGTVWAWGWNNYGQLGDGSTAQRLTPVPVSGLTGVVAIAARSGHGLALKSDGTVWAWGYNADGQLGDGSIGTLRLTPVPVSGLTGVVAIAAGHGHSLTLKSDGTVWAWGANSFGQVGDGSTTTRLTPAPVSGLTGVVAIAGGMDHSLALRSDGTVWAWGCNLLGQLGDGSMAQRSTPIPVSGLTGVVAIAGGWVDGLALKSDGTVWAWGGGSLTPVQVSGLTGVVAIAGGGYYSLALKSDGTVWAWGRNDSGQLGDGSTTDRSTPVPVSGLTGVLAIAGGGQHSLALKSDGTVWAWGANSFGQVGDGSTTNRLTPVLVSVPEAVSAPSTPSGTTSATTGASYSYSTGGASSDLGHSVQYYFDWGDGTSSGWLGAGVTSASHSWAAVGSYSVKAMARCTTHTSVESGWSGGLTVTVSPPPETVSAPSTPSGTARGMTGVSYSYWTGGAISNLGHPVQYYFDWGDGTTSGWLGAGVTSAWHGWASAGSYTVRAMARCATHTAVQSGWSGGLTVTVSGVAGVGFKAIAAGGTHSLALKSDGTVRAWGLNSSGQLGDGSTANRPTQGPVSGLSGVVAIAAGEVHSLALKSDGMVWAWGNNGYGQLGDGSTAQRLTPVPVSGLTGVVAIAAGEVHSLALKSDGTVWAWGNNYAGQLGDGSTAQRLTPVPVSGLTGVVAIAGGGLQSLALKSDARVWMWGENYFGYRSMPAQVGEVMGVVAITAGGYHILVLKSDGTVWAWGHNEYGQFGDGGSPNSSELPRQASGLTGVVAIAGGRYHSLAVRGDGTVWTWGSSAFGPLLTPVQVSGITGAVAIAGGGGHSLVLKNDGTVWAWGSNYFGQLGDGSTTDRWTPTPVFTGPVVTISGQVTRGGIALAGVPVTLAGGASDTRTTDASGTYSFAGLAAGGNYTVIPSLTNHTFTPPSAAFSNIQINQTASFIAQLVNSPPTVAGVSPGAGAGATQAFTFSFSDPNGWQDLGVVNILVNFWLDGRQSCYLAYSRPANTLYLINDAGDGYAGSMPLNGSGTLGNSQCIISGAGSSVSGSGNTMNLALNITFPASYAGAKIIYAAARDVAENNSGWQRMGVWKVPGAAQTTTTAVAGMNPTRGSGTGGTFTFTFTDTMGANDLGVMNVLVNDWLDGRHACYLAYARSNNTLYLINDNGDALLPGKVLNGSGSLGNSQCTVNGVGSSATPSGNTLTLTLNMMFGSGFAGNRVFYLAARDVNELNNTGWQAMASWTVQ